MTASCVGNPEQRRTSSAAAARSTGRMRAGAPIGDSPIGAPGSTNEVYYFATGTRTVSGDVSFTDSGVPFARRSSSPRVAST